MVFSVVLVVALARAALVCQRAGYNVGVALGWLRLSLAGLAFFYSPGAGLFFRTPVVQGNAGLSVLLTLGGPPVSFLALYLAYLRFRDVPAAEEEAAQRPFRGWLMPATADLFFVVVMIGAVYMTKDP